MNVLKEAVYALREAKKKTVLPDSARTAIEGLMRDMESDYRALVRQAGDKTSGKNYWVGLAEMVIERAADEDEALQQLLDEDPKTYDVLVKEFGKKWMKEYE